MSKVTTLQLAALVRLSNREADRRRHESRPRTQVRKGQIYRLLQEAPGGLLDKLADEQLSTADGLAIVKGLYPDKGFTDDGIRRAVNRRRNELGREKLADEWEIDEGDAWLLGVELEQLIAEAIDADDQQALEALFDDLVERFAQWRRRFIVDGKGKPRYVTAAFHRSWIRSILKARFLGNKQLILSPPRHGKSELLVDFATWNIVRFPDIRIVWVCASKDIAENMVGSVRHHLEQNRRLSKAYLPPGRTWHPEGKSAGSLWSKDAFTVETRTIIGLKTPTIVAKGKGSRILSLDADLIVCDDLEDNIEVRQPANRAGTKSWFATTVESRKEQHTGLVVIGSRQHYEDLYSTFLTDDTWEAIVETAHSDACGFDWGVYAEHKDCMLFPELRTMKWLEGQRRSYQAKGIEAIFEMAFLQKPYAEGDLVFTPDLVDRCLNHYRNVGDTKDLPRGLHYIGGLDPSPSADQAAVLIGVDVESQKQYIIDVNVRRSRGADSVADIMGEWLERYNLREWVLEENGWQKGIRSHYRVKGLIDTYHLDVRPFHTTEKKHDPAMGVVAMRSLFADDRIDIPWAHGPGHEHVRRLYDQLTSYTAETVAQLGVRVRWRKTDAVMALWFPQDRIRKSLGRPRHRSVHLQYEPSFAGYSGSEFNEAPWGPTSYPFN